MSSNYNLPLRHLRSILARRVWSKVSFDEQMSDQNFKRWLARDPAVFNLCKKVQSVRTKVIEFIHAGEPYIMCSSAYQFAGTVDEFKMWLKTEWQKLGCLSLYETYCKESHIGEAELAWRFVDGNDKMVMMNIAEQSMPPGPHHVVTTVRGECSTTPVVTDEYPDLNVQFDDFSFNIELEEALSMSNDIIRVGENYHQ